MRVLITGGAGFLGSHLVDRLIAGDHQVIVFDNLLTGRVNNIEHHLGNDRFKFVKQDVTEYLFVEGELDAVVHFASPASPIDYLQLPIQTLKVGSLGTHKALGLAKGKRARFLLASTSEVYGDPQVHPQREESVRHLLVVPLRRAERPQEMSIAARAVWRRAGPEERPQDRPGGERDTNAFNKRYNRGRP